MTHFMSLDLCRCLDRLSLLNYIDFFGVKSIIVNDVVYAKTDEKRSFPKDLFVANGNGRKSHSNGSSAWSRVTPFAADFLVANYLGKRIIRSKLVQELRVLE